MVFMFMLVYFCLMNSVLVVLRIVVCLLRFLGCLGLVVLVVGLVDGLWEVGEFIVIILD